MRIKRTYLLAIFTLVTAFSFAQAPTATIVASTNTLCSKSPATFTALITGTTTAVTWSVSPASGYTITPNNFSNVISISFTNSLTYSVTLFVANSSGTFVTGSSVSVYKSAKASYNATIDYSGFPANVKLKNYSLNA